MLHSQRMVNAGPPAWEAYAGRVRARVEAGLRALPGGGTPQDASDARDIVDEASAAAQLWREIAASQTVANPPVDCASARVLLLEYPINGFASAFGLFGGALMQARLRGRLLVLDERSGWAYAGGRERCPDMDASGQWGCYFQPVGSCTYANAGITEAQRSESVPAHSDGGSPTGGPRVVTMNLNHGSLFWHEHLAGLPVPAPFTRWGPAWWRVHHFLYLWRLNANVTRAVEELVRVSGAASVGGRSRDQAAAGSAAGHFVSWHVRHGDKVVEKHTTYSADAFLPALRDARPPWASPESRVHVFLASDDPAVTQQAPALLAPSNYTLFSLADRMKLGDSLQEAAFKARGDAQAAFLLAVEAIANVWMMSEGNAFVGEC